MISKGARLAISLFWLLVFLAGVFYGITFIERIADFTFSPMQRLSALIIGSGIGLAVGYFSAPRLVRRISLFTSWVERSLQKTPLQDIIAGAVGLIVGLIIANLFGTAFSRIPVIGAFVPTIGSIAFGYLGIVVAVKKREDIAAVLPIPSRFRSRSGQEKPLGSDRKKYGHPKILDTSAIIDGRIADIFKTGFVEGPLVIPSFVLDELRHIADSSDTLKRNRGRRGLDILNQIQKDLPIGVEIYDGDPSSNLEVDAKLVKLAQQLGGMVITNDFNLNKVAELHGVQVLNVNELANAVKPVVLPGEEMLVNIIKDGKESGQGVAYLDDGTMIVVDGGKKFIGENVSVLVTSVLQTSAGRMIFARPKYSIDKVAP
jgi:uncharacterized protein YacL